MKNYRKVCWSSIISGNDKLHVARVNAPHRDAWSLHAHDFFECFWVESGKGWHLFPSGRERLAAGTIHFVEPDHVHGFEFSGRNEEFQFVNIAIEKEVVRQFVDRFEGSYPEAVWNSNTSKPTTIELSHQQISSLRALIADLISGARRALDAEWFLSSLMRSLQSGDLAPIDYSMPSWLRNALHLMREPINLQSGIARLNQLSGKTAEHVSRVLRRHTGMRPTDWLNAARMQYASVLLQTSNLSITEVALECGYGNLSHFHHQFKRRFEVSPLVYRRLHLDGLKGNPVDS